MNLINYKHIFAMKFERIFPFAALMFKDWFLLNIITELNFKLLEINIYKWQDEALKIFPFHFQTLE